jgi:hypothetical protein
MKLSVNIYVAQKQILKQPYSELQQLDEKIQGLGYTYYWISVCKKAYFWDSFVGMHRFAIFNTGNQQGI